MILGGSSLLFQFHKGTIKTKRFMQITTEMTKFQFHKGTIKTEYVQAAAYDSNNFNSIKVQLKLNKMVCFRC